MIKSYKVGMYLGRFQPLHLGHCEIIAEALEHCEQLIVAIGSANKEGTAKNPFCFAERADMVELTFPAATKENRLIIVPINDRDEIANDASWGDYVFNKIEQACGVRPEVVFEGEEVERASWYDNLDVTVHKVSRDIIPISATKVREAILNGDDTKAIECLPFALRPHYKLIKRRINDATEN